MLAVIAGVVAAIAAGTAIAVAAAGSGPVPKREPLAQARPRRARRPSRCRASRPDITFTNNLIDASDFQAVPATRSCRAPPAACGCPATTALRLELQTDNGDAQVVVNKRLVLDLRPGLEHRLQGHAARGALGQDAGRQARRQADTGIPSIGPDPGRAQPADRARQRVRARSRATWPASPAYTVRVSPQARRRPARLGAARVGRGPRRAAADRRLRAQRQPARCCELKATNISYGPVAALGVQRSPRRPAPRSSRSPARRRPPPGRRQRQASPGPAGRATPEVSGVAAVAAPRARSRCRRPSSLVGLPRQRVHAARLGRQARGAGHLRPEPRRDRRHRAEPATPGTTSQARSRAAARAA